MKIRRRSLRPLCLLGCLCCFVPLFVCFSWPCPLAQIKALLLHAPRLQEDSSPVPWPSVSSWCLVLIWDIVCLLLLTVPARLGKGPFATRGLAASWFLLRPLFVLPTWLHCPLAKVKIIIRRPGCKSFIVSPPGRSPSCWLRCFRCPVAVAVVLARWSV